MDEPELSFGQQLRQLRRERGFSIRQLQRHANHSKTVIWEWEAGKKIPTPDVAARLDELLEGDGRLSAAITVLPPTVISTYAVEAARLYAHQGSVAEEIRRRARTAQQLDVLAVRGLGIIGLNDSLLRPAMIARTTPLKVRILLLDPDCDSALRRAEEIRESHATFTTGIKLAIARLEEVAATAENLNLEVGLYDRLPVWRIIRLDGLAWVSCFDAQWEGHESTVYEIPETAAGSLWAGYRRQFEDMHANSRRII